MHPLYNAKTEANLPPTHDDIVREALFAAPTTTVAAKLYLQHPLPRSPRPHHLTIPNASLSFWIFWQNCFWHYDILMGCRKQM